MRATRIAPLFAPMAFLLSMAAPAAGQTPVQVISDALEGNTGRSSGIGALHGGDPGVVLAVLKQQTTTLPLGTSSGGFTWEFDPVLGLVIRKSRSFGPVFADRPLTIGRHKLSVGVSTQHTAWRSLAGRNLADGSLFESYSLQDDLFTNTTELYVEHYGSTLDLRTDRTVINATYGVTRRFDLNVVVPFGRTSVAGGVDTYVTVVSSGRLFARNAASFSSVASGLADITVRGKYLLASRRGVALAVAGDLRLPTGDEDSLLGTGSLQEKATVVSSVAAGRYSPHVELGYLFAGPGLQFKPSRAPAELASAALSDEITYTLGVDAAVHGRLTVAADIVGRRLRNSAAIVRTHTVTPSVSENGPYNREQFEFHVEPGSVSLLLGTIGAKFALGSAWLLTGSVLFPLNDAGVKPGFTPVVGFERAF